MKTSFSFFCATIFALLIAGSLFSCSNNSSSTKNPAKCNHNFIDVYGESPSCTTDGKTDGVECSECGLVLLRQSVISALGHSYIGGVCEVCSEPQTKSEGLQYSSYGDGNCCVVTIGTCGDEYIIIPETSPEGDTVISIGKDAFRNTSINGISLPYTLSEIGEAAFWGCNIKEMILPKNLKIIGDYAFCLSKLKTVSFNESLERVGISAFANTLLEEIHLPESITELGSRAFYNCVNLETIELKCNIKALSVATFAQNYALKNIVLPDSITTLSYREFEDCTSLDSITLGSNLASIEDNTFSGCTALKTIYFNGKRSKWNAVSKPTGWDSSLIGYSVICSDN